MSKPSRSKNPERARPPTPASFNLNDIKKKLTKSQEESRTRGTNSRNSSRNPSRAQSPADQYSSNPGSASDTPRASPRESPTRFKPTQAPILTLPKASKLNFIEGKMFIQIYCNSEDQNQQHLDSIQSTSAVRAWVDRVIFSNHQQGMYKEVTDHHAIAMENIKARLDKHYNNGSQPSPSPRPDFTPESHKGPENTPSQQANPGMSNQEPLKQPKTQRHERPSTNKEHPTKAARPNSVSVEDMFDTQEPSNDPLRKQSDRSGKLMSSANTPDNSKLKNIITSPCSSIFYTDTELDAIVATIKAAPNTRGVAVQPMENPHHRLSVPVARAELDQSYGQVIKDQETVDVIVIPDLKHNLSQGPHVYTGFQAVGPFTDPRNAHEDLLWASETGHLSEYSLFIPVYAEKGSDIVHIRFCKEKNLKESLDHSGHDADEPRKFDLRAFGGAFSTNWTTNEDSSDFRPPQHGEANMSIRCLASSTDLRNSAWTKIYNPALIRAVDVIVTTLNQCRDFEESEDIPTSITESTKSVLFDISAYTRRNTDSVNTIGLEFTTAVAINSIPTTFKQRNTYRPGEAVEFEQDIFSTYPLSMALKSKAPFGFIGPAQIMSWPTQRDHCVLESKWFMTHSVIPLNFEPAAEGSTCIMSIKLPIGSATNSGNPRFLDLPMKMITVVPNWLYLQLTGVPRTLHYSDAQGEEQAREDTEEAEPELHSNRPSPSPPISPVIQPTPADGLINTHHQPNLGPDHTKPAQSPSNKRPISPTNEPLHQGHRNQPKESHHPPPQELDRQAKEAQQHQPPTQPLPHGPPTEEEPAKHISWATVVQTRSPGNTTAFNELIPSPVQKTINAWSASLSPPFGNQNPPAAPTPGPVVIGNGDEDSQGFKSACEFEYSRLDLEIISRIFDLPKTHKVGVMKALAAIHMNDKLHNKASVPLSSIESIIQAGASAQADTDSILAEGTRTRLNSPATPLDQVLKHPTTIPAPPVKFTPISVPSVFNPVTEAAQTTPGAQIQQEATLPTVQGPNIHSPQIQLDEHQDSLQFVRKLKHWGLITTIANSSNINEVAEAQLRLMAVNFHSTRTSRENAQAMLDADSGADQDTPKEHHMRQARLVQNIAEWNNNRNHFYSDPKMIKVGAQFPGDDLQFNPGNTVLALQAKFVRDVQEAPTLAEVIPGALVRHQGLDWKVIAVLYQPEHPQKAHIPKPPLAKLSRDQSGSTITIHVAAPHLRLAEAKQSPSRADLPAISLKSSILAKAICEEISDDESDSEESEEEPQPKPQASIFESQIADAQKLIEEWNTLVDHKPTAVISASKTLPELLAKAERARNWLLKHHSDEDAPYTRRAKEHTVAENHPEPISLHASQPIQGNPQTQLKVGGHPLSRTERELKKISNTKHFNASAAVEQPRPSSPKRKREPKTNPGQPRPEQSLLNELHTQSLITLNTEPTDPTFRQPIPRPHIQTIHSRHLELEEKLYALWQSCIPNHSQGHPTTPFAITMIQPLLQACGLTKRSTMEPWIKELGECRSLVTKHQWDFATSLVSPEEASKLPRIGRWRTCYTDGSCYNHDKTEGKAAKAGSGVHFPSTEEQGPEMAFQNISRNPSSDAAELEATVCARFEAGPWDDLLIWIDCNYAKSLVSHVIPSWVKAIPQRIANRAQTLLLGFEMKLASGATYALKVPAHSSCPGNERADTLAKVGAVLSRTVQLKENHYLFLASIDRNRLEDFILTWGEQIDKTSKPNTFAFPSIAAVFTDYTHRDTRFLPNCKLPIGSQPVKEHAVRQDMLPYIKSTFDSLVKLRQEAVQLKQSTAMNTLLKLEDSIEGRKFKIKFDQIVTQYDAFLWGTVVKHYGTTRNEFTPDDLAPREQHTSDFKQQATNLVEVLEYISCAQTALDRLTANLKFTDFTLDQQGQIAHETVAPSDSLDIELILWESVARITTHTELEQPIDVSQCFTLLEEARMWTKARYNRLKQCSEEDQRKQKRLRPAALWKACKLKVYFRHLKTRTLNRQVEFKIVPEVYLKFLAQKEVPSTFPTLTQLTEDPSFDTSYPSIFTISPSHTEALSAPFTDSECLKALIKMKHSSAPSPISQMSYKLHQLTLSDKHKALIIEAKGKKYPNQIRDSGTLSQATHSLGAATQRYRNSWEEYDQYYDTTSLEQAVLTRAPQNRNSFHQAIGQMEQDSDEDDLTIDPEDQDAVGIHNIIKVISDIMAVTAIAPQSFNNACVKPLTKVKPEQMNSLTPEEFEEAETTCKKWREVQLADSPIRKIIGSVAGSRVLRHIKATNMHCDIQYGYLPGVDPARLNHLKMNLARELSQTASGCCVILILDLESYFSYLKHENTTMAYEYIQLPQNLRNIFQAMQSGKQIFMTAKGKISKPVPMPGDFQGTSESCSDAVAITIELCTALVNSGVGYRFPNQGTTKAHTMPAIMQCDDLKIITGGHDVPYAQAISEMQTLNQIVQTWAIRNKLMFAVDTDPEKSKTVYILNINCTEAPSAIELPIVTRDGIRLAPKLPAHMAQSDLGIKLHQDHHLTQYATFDSAATIFGERIKDQICPDLPAQGQICSLQVSSLGALSWLGDKGACIPIHLAEHIVKIVTKLAKSAVGLPPSSSTAVIYSPRNRYGMGMINFTDSILKRTLSNTIKDKNSKCQNTRQWSEREMQYTAWINNIPLVEYHTAGFFNWDTSNLTYAKVLKLPSQNAHTTALAACFKFGLRTVAILAKGEKTIGIAPQQLLQFTSLNRNAPFDATDAAVGAGAVSRLLTKQADMRFWTKLMQQKAGELLQQAETIDRKHSNAWKNNRQISSAVFKFGITATTGQTVTPAVKCYRWGVLPNARCPMGGCGYQHCDLNHILQHCQPRDGLIKGMRSLRHNSTFPIVTEHIKKQGTAWHYIGEPEHDPPPFLVPTDWKHRVMVLTPAGQRPATKPDQIIANILSKDKMEVCIIEMAIAWESCMEEVEERKRGKYEPLAAVITDFLSKKYERIPSVKVVPLVIGARGTIMNTWNDRMRDLRLDKSRALAINLSAEVLTKSAHMYFQWSEKARLIETLQNSRM